jgi:hypothetical protein
MKSKKKLIASVCIIASVAIFSVSAAAAVSNITGYERLKEASFSLVDLLQAKDANATLKTQFKLTQNGKATHSLESIYEAVGSTYYTSETTTNAADDTEQFQLETYRDNDTLIRGYNGKYNTYKRGDNEFDYSERSIYEFTPSHKRLITLVSDSLMGDTKNYFLTNGDNVTITLSDHQVPEIAQLFLTILAESISKFDPDDLDGFILGENAKFSLIKFEGTLDSKGNLTASDLKINVTSTVNGKSQDYELAAKLSLTKIGLTKLTRPSTGEGTAL